MIPAPVILYPKTDWTTTADRYSSDNLIQMISGDIPVVPADIVINTFFSIRYRYKIDTVSGPGTWTAFSYVGITVGSTNANVTAIPWSFNSDGVFQYVAGDTLNFEYKTVKLSSYYGEVGPIIEESSVSNLIVDIVTPSEITASADPVTGVKIKRYTDHIKVIAPQSGIFLNTDCDFAGCNFYLSLTAGGGTTGYVLMNNVLVTSVDDSETEDVVIEDTSTTDTVNNLTVETLKTRQVTNLFYTYTLDKAVIAHLVVDGKIPNIFLSDGQTLSEDVVYYFIVTAMIFDKTLNETVESPYSIELEGTFLRYTTTYQTLPKRSRSDILFSISQDMMTNNELISVIPGSVIRDMLDPVSLEFEKFYVIEDFIFTTLSIDTLLNFDDQDGDGVSDPVELNPRKSALMNALGITDPVNLQLLIDEQFDKLAANFNIKRKLATKAVGTVLFYTNIQPTQNILISDGLIVSSQANLDLNIASISFSVQGSQILDISNLVHYYNPTTKQYEVEANIQAQLVGSRGNVPAGSIIVSNSLPPTIAVTNSAPTRFGTDRETNQDLANRIKLAKISFDSGTEGGYSDTAYNVPGVIQARIQKAGDPLMMRDYDPETKKHIGGKVDVYVKGINNVQLVDQVAFKYDYPTDTFGNKVGEQASIINANEYTVRTTNSKVTDLSPIVSVSKVRNLTKAKDYSLVGLQIIGDGDTIVLEKNYQNLSIGMATLDVIEINYLYRSSNSIALTSQPVEEIVSVVSSTGVVIDTSKYTLVKIEDPLQNGRSSIASDSIKFFFNENDDIPEFIQITNESHTMLLDTPTRLSLKGVDISTIVVGPGSGTGPAYLLDVDYSVTVGSESAYTYLNLLRYGKIRHGDTVLVSYKASENYSVTYIHNGLIPEVQDAIDVMKHACADTVVKESVRNLIDLSFRVVRETGTGKGGETNYSLLKSRIQTAVANYLANLKMGDTFTQGELISVIHGVDGVKEIKIPMTRMMKRNGSFISLDDLGHLTFEVYQKTSGSGVTSYRTMENVLSYKTSNGGGDPNLFRGIHEDNILLTTVTSASDVAKGQGRGYIQADGRIVVSTTDGYAPQSKYYKASYYTYYAADENIVQDLVTNEVEYLDVDSVSMRDIEVLDERVTKRGL
jgi:uncharacterized phage protein gp47/JayE